MSKAELLQEKSNHLYMIREIERFSGFTCSTKEHLIQYYIPKVNHIYMELFKLKITDRDVIQKLLKVVEYDPKHLFYMFRNNIEICVQYMLDSAL